jgi:CO dehydrogenase maturation factor
MKLAISGKGGVGKSSIAGALALVLSEMGNRVLALDADPDANLASALGFPKDIRQRLVPVSAQLKLIEERTGAKVKQYGQIFRLNPDVSDVANQLAVSYNGVSLLILGAVKQGGGGCACPESVFIRSLVTDLVLYQNECLIMDMEAGIEHLGRATAKGVDLMLVVVEPSQRSIECAQRVIAMSKEIGIRDVQIVLNKVTNADDDLLIRHSFPDLTPLAAIPFSEAIRLSDQTGQTVTALMKPELVQLFKNMAHHLLRNYSQ